MRIDMDTHYTPFETLRRLDGQFGQEGFRFGYDPDLQQEVIYFQRFRHGKTSSVPDLGKRIDDKDIAGFDKQVLICGSQIANYQAKPEIGLEISPFSQTS